MWLKELFKKKPKENTPSPKINVPKPAEKVKVCAVRGKWEPASPKYANIQLVTDYLISEGFGNFRAQTTGETSSHMWTFGFDSRYGSMEDFLAHSYDDYKKDVEANSRSGPEIDWSATYFTLDKELPENKGKLSMFMAVTEKDHLSFNTEPVEVHWSFSFPEDMASCEEVMKIVAKIENM